MCKTGVDRLKGTGCREISLPMIDKLCISLATSPDHIPTPSPMLTRVKRVCVCVCFDAIQSRALLTAAFFWRAFSHAIFCATALRSVGRATGCTSSSQNPLPSVSPVQTSYLYKEIRSEEAGNMTCRSANDSWEISPPGSSRAGYQIHRPPASRSLNGALVELNKQHGQRDECRPI